MDSLVLKILIITVITSSNEFLDMIFSIPLFLNLQIILGRKARIQGQFDVKVKVQGQIS